MKTEQYLYYIAYHKGKLILFTAVIMVIVFCSFYNPIAKEHWNATISFYIPSSEYITNNQFFDGKSFSISNNDEIQQINSFSNSKELYEFIVDSFQLADEYGIPADDPERVSKAITQFESNYYVKPNIRKELMISITDESKTKAKQLAEAIVYKINDLNNQYILQIKNIQLAVCDRQIAHLKKELETIYNISDTFDGSINSMTSRNIQILKERIKDINGMKFQILTSQELLNKKKPIIISERLKNAKPMNAFAAFVWSLIAGINAFVLSVLIVVVNIRYRKEIMILLNGKKYPGMENKGIRIKQDKVSKKRRRKKQPAEWKQI